VTAPFEELADLDKVVHEPARLAILTALAACQQADFMFLQRITGLTKGYLSSHLNRLEEEGLITITKQFAGKVPQTLARLTAEGRHRTARHWDRLGELRQQTVDWQPTND
jgi:DNA-binding transcriptional ArsR family regulator